MSKNNGGPAFPVQGFEYLNDANPADPERVVHAPYPGMTLRDYFAAKAMQAVISYGVEKFTFQEGETPGQMAARQAYKTADAMLAEREREQ